MNDKDTFPLTPEPPEVARASHFGIATNGEGGHIGFSLGNQTVQRRAKDWLAMEVAPDEMSAAQEVAASRVEPLRMFDQISMKAGDLLRQVKIIAPYLAEQRVVFIGDNDGASRLLMLLSAMGSVPPPASLILLDFDERIVELTRAFADKHGFRDRFDTRCYNVFDPVPADIVSSHDWFYVNPPYGAHNDGESIRLFTERGMELCDTNRGRGCILIPDDPLRPWSEMAMWNIQGFVHEGGWIVDEKLNGMHAYHLDEDDGLTSCLLTVRSARVPKSKLMPYQGRRVALGEIPRFYGRSVKTPYPRYIRQDGSPDYDWD